MQTVKELQKLIPLLGASLAGCHWWIIAGITVVTVFLHGAEPAMRWLDVIDRVCRRDRRSERAA
jgi:hypothetical protein